MPAERAFLDTNILIYSLSEDTTKAIRAEVLLREGGVISVQVLNEFANVLRRKLNQSWPEIRELSTIMRGLLTVVPLNEDMHVSGLKLAERFNLSLYDAMIISAAQESQCLVLWSEDMQDGMQIDGLRISNPFRPRP